MLNFIKRLFLFFFIILTTFIIGPILSTSYYYSIKSNNGSINLTSFGFIIAIIIGLIDSTLYGNSLYLSSQTVSELYNQRIFIDKKIVNYQKHFLPIIVQEKQLLQPISESIELLIRTQTDLYDLIKELVEDKTTDKKLIQNLLNKLTTLEFIQKNGIMTIKKNIDESLQLLNLNSSISKYDKQSLHTYINNSTLSDLYIFDRIYLYIFTFSFLLYIHQITLWFFQYLSLKNPLKYLSYSLILSVIILSQSLGLIYFLQITNTFHFLSSFNIYTCIFFIRSVISIYHYAFFTH